MKNKLFFTFLLCLVLPAAPLQAAWQKMPAPDVDKEFISGNEGLVVCAPPQDNSCWMAAASNMLAAVRWEENPYNWTTTKSPNSP